MFSRLAGLVISKEEISKTKTKESRPYPAVSASVGTLPETASLGFRLIR